MSSSQPHTLPAPLLHAIQELAAALSNITKCKYTSVAGLTIVLYDILLLLSDEIRLVWHKPRMNASRIAYFINRYVPPVFLIVANYQLGGFRGPLTDKVSFALKPSCTASQRNSCKVWISTASITQVLTGICATYILVLRVLALYGASRNLSIVIYTLFTISYGICMGITINAVLVIKEKAYFDPLVHVCSVKSTPEIFRFIFLTPVFFEILIGVLTFWKGLQHAYVISHASAAPMIHIMLRDGLIYFTSVVGLRLWNALIWVFLPQSLIYLGIYILWALVSTFVSRFFLNILNIASVGSVDGFSIEYATVREKERAAARQGTNTVSGVDFALQMRLRRGPHDTFDDLYTDSEMDASVPAREAHGRSKIAWEEPQHQV
ncbi:hypothetical protein FRC19_000289 [Serendipita sp. 401]|nr:hypothetical protein FRC19_000289 [Serendipita sp. 401]